ncbi:MAG: hypothetical protein PWP67_2957 [Clostridium butyricum]|nr:hypothetical protein [Clostridium butyricum]
MKNIKNFIKTIIKYPTIEPYEKNLNKLPINIKNRVIVKIYTRLFISAIIGTLIAYPFCLYTESFFNIWTLIGIIFAGFYFYCWFYFSF